MRRIFLFMLVSLNGYFEGPNEVTKNDDPVVAGLMNSLPKIVVLKSLEAADWNNTRLVKKNVPKEIAKLKHQPGKEIAIFGSSDLAASLAQKGPVDEYRIMVNPVILGEGKPLFKGADKLGLKLIKARTFRSGNVLLYYQPPN